MTDEHETIRRVLDGDYDAFETFVEKYQARIYRHICKMVPDKQLAQDLLQETFLSAYKGLGSFSGASSFSTWLFKIATNTALMFLRKHQPECIEYEDHLENVRKSDLVPASPEFVNTPLEILLSVEGRKKIEEAIDSLPVLYRSVLILRDVEGFSIEEVSQIMEASVAAVKSRLHRARHAVRESLSSYYGEKRFSENRRVS
jgi:RNA polymerase sigma-70 factor, ECF subfamily